MSSIEAQKAGSLSNHGVNNATPGFDFNVFFESTSSTVAPSSEAFTAITGFLETPITPPGPSYAHPTSMGSYQLDVTLTDNTISLPIAPFQPFYSPVYVQEAVNFAASQTLNPQVFGVQGNHKYDEAWEASFTSGCSSSFLEEDEDLQQLTELCGGFALPPSQAFDMNSVDPALLSKNTAEERALLQPLVDQNSMMEQQQPLSILQCPAMYQRSNSKRSRSEFEELSEEIAELSGSEYEGSDEDSSGEESSSKKGTPGQKAKKTRKRSPKTARDKKKSHTRGASTSGGSATVVFVAPLYMPGPPIMGWIPQSYTGPPAESQGTINVTNSYNKPVTYTHYKPLPGHGKFTRDARGWLDRDIVFTIEDMAEFIRTHPLGKNLLFRLEKRCVYSGTRYTDAQHTTCRSKCCLVSGEKRTIREGQFRIAIEEVWGRIPRRDKFNNDPFFCAGYLHVECFEHLVDIGQLIRMAMLRSFPRVEIEKEPRTSKTEPNRLCLSEKIDNCFRRFCKRLNDDPLYQGYNTNVVEKLSTQLWLTNVRKGKTSLGVKPAQLSQEMAKHLIATKSPDPGWGGSRFTGIRVAQAEAVLSIGAKDKLKGSAHNVRAANQEAYELVMQRAKLDDFSDGEEWAQVVFGVDETAKYSGMKSKKQKTQRAFPGTPGYVFPANKNRSKTPIAAEVGISQIPLKELEDLFSEGNF